MTLKLLGTNILEYTPNCEITGFNEHLRKIDIFH